MSLIDRNAPCSCGSGRKYKKCCAWKDATARAAADRMGPAREASGEAATEEKFIAELKPEVDAELDRLLERLERGERESVRAKIISLHQRYPGYHMTNYAMGIYRGMVEEDVAGAIPFFEKAVRIYPPFPEAHYNLGSSLVRSGRVGPAVAAFRKAIRYSTGDQGIAKLARDRISAVERIAIKSSPFATLDAYIANEQLFELAFERLKQLRYSEAAEMFGRALEQNPNHVQSHGNLALCLAGLGRKAAALACLHRALELDPSYQPARTNRKAIEGMTEGEPFVPGMVAETEYYRERLEAQQGGRPRAM